MHNLSWNTVLAVYLDDSILHEDQQTIMKAPGLGTCTQQSSQLWCWRLRPPLGANTDSQTMSQSPSVSKFFPQVFIKMQLGWMGCNLLSLEGSGNSSFSKASLQLNSSVFSLLIIECLGQLVVSGYLLPLLTSAPKCISIFCGIITIDRENDLPSWRITQRGRR